MSENATIFDKMGEYIERILYDSNSSNSPHFIDKVVTDTNYDGKYYLETNIKYFNQKIIIICYCKNQNLIRELKSDVKSLSQEIDKMNEKINFIYNYIVQKKEKEDARWF